jgi:hypothetical protein
MGIGLSVQVILLSIPLHAPMTHQKSIPIPHTPHSKATIESCPETLQLIDPYSLQVFSNKTAANSVAVNPLI